MPVETQTNTDRLSTKTNFFPSCIFMFLAKNINKRKSTESLTELINTESSYNNIYGISVSYQIVFFFKSETKLVSSDFGTPIKCHAGETKVQDITKSYNLRIQMN